MSIRQKVILESDELIEIYIFMDYLQIHIFCLGYIKQILLNGLLQDINIELIMMGIIFFIRVYGQLM